MGPSSSDTVSTIGIGGHAIGAGAMDAIGPGAIGGGALRAGVGASLHAFALGAVARAFHAAGMGTFAVSVGISVGSSTIVSSTGSSLRRREGGATPMSVFFD
jgi:hypothetical protein